MTRESARVAAAEILNSTPRCVCKMCHASEAQHLSWSWEILRQREAGVKYNLYCGSFFFKNTYYSNWLLSRQRIFITKWKPFAPLHGLPPPPFRRAWPQDHLGFLHSQIFWSWMATLPDPTSHWCRYSASYIWLLGRLMLFV